MRAEPKSCPQCGALLSGASDVWLCPRCLLSQAASAAPEQQQAQMPSTEGASGPKPSVLHYFGDYELLHETARGGMGVVYKARQVSLNRIVAIKMLLFGKLAGGDFIKRFRAEAEAAASLQHPNIVAIHEVGEHDGQQYFSMDYVEGSDLGALVREKPMPAKRAAAYLKTIAEAIHYAHQRGILHRDLKPSNVLIDANDEPRVTDFGLAKRIVAQVSKPAVSPTSSRQGVDAEGNTVAFERAADWKSATQQTGSLRYEDDLTVSGQILGTPGFISPEQAGGKRGAVGPAGDVYSLGALLYFLVTARAPFAADSLEETLRQVHEAEPVSPRLLNASVPRDLETICLKCLSKEPKRRYASAQALADDLRRWLNHEPIRARPIGRAEKLWSWCRRKPAMAVLAVALTVVAGAGLAGILWQWQRAETHAASETSQRVRAEEALTLLELQRAEELFEKDEITLAMAYLARIVRQQPTNRVAVLRLLSALSQRNFALPVAPPLPHDKKVPYATFSPDGSRVATVSLDFHARLWDARTGALLAPPMVHENAVRFAEFSPDGTRLLTFADDHRAYLWDATSSRALGRPMSHPKTINTAHFSPDGSRVLTASEDGTARLWDGRSGQPVSRATLHHQDAIWSASFSPDGKWIVTASKDHTAQVWDAATLQPRGKPFRHRGAVSGAEFSPDAKWLITMGHDTTCMWDLMSGEPLSKSFSHPVRIHSARFSPDGQRILTAPVTGGPRIWKSRDLAALAVPLSHRGLIIAIDFGPEGERVLTASSDNTARLWDAENGEALTPPMQHDGMLWSARFSPDGMFAVTASADQTARIWDIRPGAVRSLPLLHSDLVVGAEFSPDGEWIVTASNDHTAKLWNSRTCQKTGFVLRHEAPIGKVQFSPDGQSVATGSYDTTARIWDARSGKPVTAPLRHEGQITDLQFSPDGELLATASADGTVRIWNARTGEPRGEPIRHQSIVHFICFSPDGRRLLSSDFKEDIAHIWDIASGKLLAQTAAREGNARYGEFSPDGERLVTASEDGTARIWGARTGQPLAKPLLHKGVVRCARFTRDGRRVVTASEDTTARIWDVATGEPVGDPLRHGDAVLRAEFSPDGMLVVTASNDGTARLWDTRSGRPVSEPFVHRDKVVSARFSPDGRHVLTASRDGSARLWDVPPMFPDASASKESLAIFLAEVAEMVIGKRVNAQGALESVSSPDLNNVRQRLKDLPPDAEFARWLEWFFSDRSTRNISPYSHIALPNYIWSRAKETNLASVREALMLSPTHGSHGYAFAQLARHHLRQSKSPDSAEAAQADWASRQAVRFARWDWWRWHWRIETVAHTGAWTNLLDEAEKAIGALPRNHYAWNTKAHALLNLNQLEAAVAAWTRALQIGDQENRFQTEILLRRGILVERGKVLRRLGHLTEAAADNVTGLGLPAREPQAGPNLIDLSAFYNGGAPEEFPGAIANLAGTKFDFRGWVHLDNRRVFPELNLPERIDGIPIGAQCRRLHFLHTASHTRHLSTGTNGRRTEHLNVPFGVAVGHYIIHYADGQQVDIPILYGPHVRDYWQVPESAPDDPALVVAWSGSSAHSRQNGATTRLYKSTWENPRPDMPINNLDFVHADTHAAPILVAITAE